MVDCSLNQSMNLQTDLISIVDGQSLKVFEIWYACMKFDSSKTFSNATLLFDHPTCQKHETEATKLGQSRESRSFLVQKNLMC